ncbi:MAG: glycosyltransferase [Pseudomonadota bacterium]
MNILFFTHPYPNYVPDLLLHGLRKLLGPNVVDYPRKDCLYEGVLGLGVCPDDQRCPDWFPVDDGRIDREDIQKKVLKGYFRYIICDVRAVNLLQKSFSQLPSGLIFIDGEDIPVKIKPGPYVICRRETDGTDFSIPLPMALPEELLKWIASYDNVSKQYSIGFLGSGSQGERQSIAETLTRIYPDALLQSSAVPSEVKPSPDGRLGRDDYYLNLQRCHIVLSLPGLGYDTFRFWESAACNTVHISKNIPLYIPNDFVNEEHILRFSGIDELIRIIDRVLDEKVRSEEILKKGREHLINFHLTTKRAMYFLKRVEMAFNK